MRPRLLATRAPARIPHRPSRPPRPRHAHLARTRHHSSSSAADSTTPATTALSPRWLSDVKRRLGRCLSFGLDGRQKAAAAAVLQALARDWRDLVVGSEGFLTAADRRGFYRYPIQWGEQDPMVGCSLP